MGVVTQKKKGDQWVLGHLNLAKRQGHPLLGAAEAESQPDSVFGGKW